ncbi:hypothetical protein PITC_039250 [Penicillium italicum]|uniref:Uncharacterized protein n=1 Tax=Penicillium italicum TaxID=40296 RepID=A0A0A2L132_PENIT|nr:hypothetical protein PITC_039250 [Penicillium italicum]
MYLTVICYVFSSVNPVWNSSQHWEGLMSVK